LGQLFGRLALHILESHPGRVWFTSLAGIPSSLVRMATFLEETFPAPGVSRPSETHVAIAREVNTKHRDKMLIASTATWEEESFVFRGCNVGDQRRCFIKDLDDPQYWHPDKAANSFYRSLLRRREGDAVLQVGWINIEKLAELAELNKSGKNLEGLCKVCFFPSILLLDLRSSMI
jgi:hypothetical protein